MEKKVIKIQKANYYNGFFEKTLERLLKEHYILEYSDKPDFLFYTVYGREHYKYQDCVKILYAKEGIIPDFNECDYAIGFYPMTVGDRYLQIPYPEINPEIQNREKFKNIDLASKKFCNFVYSNPDNGKGAILRQEFCKQLMEYKTVDCPGKVLNNMKDAIAPRHGKGWYQGKIDFLKNYKFTIAFENAAMPGMVTEKLLQAYEAGSVPIYWGDPEVIKVFDERSFINCNDCVSWDEVVEKIKEIDNDDEKYMNMLLTPPMMPDYKIVGDSEISNFLVEIIEKGNHPFEKDPLGWDAGSLAAKQLLQMERNVFYKLYKLQQKGIKAVAKLKRKVK